MAQWNEIPASRGKEALSRTYPAGYRTDVIDVPIQGELEYMVRMSAGGTLVYSWEVPGVGNPESFYTEFHGHTEVAPGKEGAHAGDLMFYEKAAGSKASGSLIAPWQGIHGWYWQNKSGGPVTVRLRMSGFYELIPGQAGQPATSNSGARDE
jgi:hypothetical protein